MYVCMNAYIIFVFAQKTEYLRVREISLGGGLRPQVCKLYLIHAYAYPYVYMFWYKYAY